MKKSLYIAWACFRNGLAAHTGGQGNGQSEVRKASLNCAFLYVEGRCIQPNTKTALHHGHKNLMYIHLYSHNYQTDGIHNVMPTYTIRNTALSIEAISKIFANIKENYFAISQKHRVLLPLPQLPPPQLPRPLHHSQVTNLLI